MSSAGEPFPLLELPDTAVSCVFEQLGLQDACRLSWACKSLRALSGRATHRRYACARCRHPVFDPCVVFNAEPHTGKACPTIPLQDGKTWAAEVEHLPGAVLSKEHRSQDLYLRCALQCLLGRHEAAELGYEVRVQSLSCGGCGLYLGMRLVQLGEHRLGEFDGTGLVLHAAVLGRCWLPRRYLTLVKADGSEDPQGVQCSRVAVCAAARSKLANPGQCGALLFEERAVLSRQHCWDAGGGHETAWYINHFKDGAVVERNERAQQLCQGEMHVSDVYCTKCGDRIGWRFCKDLDGHDNDNQMGRYGIVRSAFKLRTG